MTDTLAPETTSHDDGPPTVNPAAGSPANQQTNFASRPMTATSTSRACATAARSTSTASGSRTSRRTRRSATRSG